MSHIEYRWRQLSVAQREELLAWRQKRGNPWHSPPHRPSHGQFRFHVTAACYEHQPHIGLDWGRMDAFARELLVVINGQSGRVLAWCVLPNHYHVLVEIQDILGLLAALGRFHGRTSHAWNGEERTRGRKVFFRAMDRTMRSERHYWATMNYVHHNPVHHGYTRRWVDWPWSSAMEYLAQTGPEEAQRIWREYPPGDYGKGWDGSER